MTGFSFGYWLKKNLSFYTRDQEINFSICDQYSCSKVLSAFMKAVSVFPKE